MEFQLYIKAKNEQVSVTDHLNNYGRFCSINFID